MTDPLSGQLLHGPTARWRSPRTGAGLVLPLTADCLDALPATLDTRETTLQRKHEFHLTLLNAAQWARARHAHGTSAVRAAFEQLDWRLRADGRYWWVQKAGVAGGTLITGVDAPALAAFRAALADATGALEPPCPHVTLYWQGAARAGIGLSGPEQWETHVSGEASIDWAAGTAVIRSRCGTPGRTPPARR